MRRKHSQRPLPVSKWVLYEGNDGEPLVWWNYRGQASGLFPPPFHWVVQAKSAKQACFFVHRGQRAFRRYDLGILWDRERDTSRPPPI